MSQTVRPQHRRRRTANGETERQPTVEAEEFLSLLGDEYTRTVLEAIAETPLSGGEIVERTGFSKATVYRRLDRLEEAGLVTSETVFDPDGHHRERFELGFAGATCQFGPDGIETNVHPAEGVDR